MLYPLLLDFGVSEKRIEREIYGKIKETLSHPGFENLMMPRLCNFFCDHQLSTNQNTMPDNAHKSVLQYSGKTHMSYALLVLVSFFMPDDG